MTAPRFPIGHSYMSAGKFPKPCTIVDIHTTLNAAGEIVRQRYVSTHEFMGQTVTTYDVTETEIAKGSAQ